MNKEYDLTTPTNHKWSGKLSIPAIGDKVRITFNGLGTGSVKSYFHEAGFLGIAVLLDEQPDWHEKQCGVNHPALVFGAEVEAE